MTWCRLDVWRRLDFFKLGLQMDITMVINHIYWDITHMNSIPYTVYLWLCIHLWLELHLQVEKKGTKWAVGSLVHYASIQALTGFQKTCNLGRSANWIHPSWRSSFFHRDPSFLVRPTLWLFNIAMENGPIYRWFTYQKWWFSMAMLVITRWYTSTWDSAMPLCLLVRCLWGQTMNTWRIPLNQAVTKGSGWFWFSGKTCLGQNTIYGWRWSIRKDWLIQCQTQWNFMLWCCTFGRFGQILWFF